MGFVLYIKHISYYMKEIMHLWGILSGDEVTEKHIAASSGGTG
jgi:hypothetical protein